MFLHAEGFSSATAARIRYLELRIGLSDAGETEAACYYMICEGEPVVAVVMPTAPAAGLPGRKGRPVTLPPELWRSLTATQHRHAKWYGADCPGEIARQADALYAHLVGITPNAARPTPGHAGVHLMDDLMPRGIRRQGVSPWPAPVLSSPPIVRDINWTDPTAAEAPGHYLHCYDKHGSYLNATSTLELGYAGLEHRAGPLEFNKSEPGYWLVSRPTDSAPTWTATPLLAYNMSLPDAPAYRFHEAYVWRGHKRCLSAWYERLRDARTALLQRIDASGGKGHDLVADMAYKALKGTYTQSISLLRAQWFIDNNRTDSPAFRPDWMHMIKARAAAVIYANVARMEWDPVAISNDALFFLSDEADPIAAAPPGMRLGSGLGQYDVKYGALPVTDEVRTWLATSKAWRLEGWARRVSGEDADSDNEGEADVDPDADAEGDRS
jgi:hypothetical protein